MKILPLLALSTFAAAPLLASETRQLGIHQHGVGQLDIAFDGTQIAMELHAPGADIAGFEYAPKSAEDRAAIDDAIATLTQPLKLFIFPPAAECSVVHASAELESADAHADHNAHKHGAHATAAGHTEFHAEYLLNCSDPTNASQITFAYFDAFSNALKLEIQVISGRGATAFEVGRKDPSLDLRGLF